MMNTERKKRRPSSIQLDRENKELIITWQDGYTGRYDLAELRRTCPCANCKEAREKAANAPASLNLLQDEAATATAQVNEIERVGRYGIRIKWADGHDYGIYTFQALRARDQAAE